MISYLCIFFAVPTPVRLLGLGNSQCLFRTIAKLSRYDGIVFFAVPAPAPLLRAISLCTISVFIPIENPRLTIVHFGKTLRVYTQPAINLRFYAQTSNACLSHARMAFCTFLLHPTFVQRRDDAK